MTLQRLRQVSRLRETAPALAMVCALLLPRAFPHDPATVEADGAELEMIAAAVEAVPYRIGPWVGQDVPIPEAARRLLRPNAILSRRFINLMTGATVDLALVHCADARDMLGHYPPVCYPSNGWSTGGVGEGCDFGHGGYSELALHELPIPVRVYGFTRTRGWSNESRIRVHNFFILPGGALTADIEDVGLRTNWLGARISGVAQVQLLTDAGMPCDDAARVAGEILVGLAAVFDSLGVNLP